MFIVIELKNHLYSLPLFKKPAQGSIEECKHHTPEPVIPWFEELKTARPLALTNSMEQSPS
jgi:hypothetical protein